MPKDINCPSSSHGTPSTEFSVVNLKWTTVGKDIHSANSDSIKNYVSAVNEKARGRVKIQVYWDSELGKVQDTLKMLQTGIADIGYLVTAYVQWEIPLNAAGGLPFMTTGYRIAPQALKALYDEWPPMQKELTKAGVRPLYFSQSHEHYMGINRPIAGLKDLRGMRIWGGGYWANMLKELGATHVPLTTPEVYEALRNSIIDGFITTFVQIVGEKFYKYTKYLVTWPFGGGVVNPTAISLKAWDKISPADQKIMMDEAGKVPAWLADQTDAEFSSKLNFLKENGVHQITLTAADITRGIEIGKPAIYDAWLATCKEKGVPGQEFIERYVAKIEQFTK
jgi:TRAP-type C4-dicarboxylate transport system substrate-binding protein